MFRGVVLRVFASRMITAMALFTKRLRSREILH